MTNTRLNSLQKQQEVKFWSLSSSKFTVNKKRNSERSLMNCVSQAVVTLWVSDVIALSTRMSFVQERNER